MSGVVQDSARVLFCEGRRVWEGVVVVVVNGNGGSRTPLPPRALLVSTHKWGSLSAGGHHHIFCFYDKNY